LIGDGPLKQDLEVQTRKANIVSHVHFLDYIPYENVPNWYIAADLAVMPSLNEWFGKVAAEAMACGTPVVATEAGGAIDIVKEFECGILVPPRDSKTLASAIVDSLMQPDIKKPNIVRAKSVFGWSAKLTHAFKIFDMQRNKL
jgi:glycosyltransferase involved in cell wall biosynthesis